MNTIDVNRHSKLGEMLSVYPHLEDLLQSLSPIYKNLKNPILRKTVLKIATLEKVAQVGGLDVYYVVNTLRNAVGQEPILPEDEDAEKNKVAVVNNAPEWAEGNPVKVIDGVEMLDRGEHPLGLVMQTMSQIQPGEYIILKTNFKPMPLIEKMEEAGYKVHHQIENQNPAVHLTFIGK